MRVAAFLGVVLLSACLVSNAPLPAASATLHWATIDLPRGSYCWATSGHGECADSPGPDFLLQRGDLKPYRTAGGFDVKITFRSSSTLQHFDVQLMVSPEGQLGPVSLNGPDTFPIGMSPPARAGVYVYVIRGTWAEGSVDFFLALDLIPGSA